MSVDVYLDRWIQIERAGVATPRLSWRWFVRSTIGSRFFTGLKELLQFLRRELNVKYTHLLELSTTEPRQYRITVVEEKPVSIVAHMLEREQEGFTIVGWYDTPEQLLEILIPYLQMEQGK